MTSEKNSRIYLAILFDIAVVILGVMGDILEVQRIGAGLFEFYTEDSNILAQIACAIHGIASVRLLLRKDNVIPTWMKILKYISVCCLTVTFLVVVLILAPMNAPHGYSQMLLHGSMLYHHLLCPVIALISFFFFDTEPTLYRRSIVFAMIPTAVYAAVTIVLNIAKIIKGPYPFLFVYQQPVWMSVVWCVLILGIALGIAWLVWFVNFKMTHRKKVGGTV